MRLTVEITGLFVGTVATLLPGKPPSAIAKRSVPGPLELTSTGFATDEQADLAVHGGPEKAVHHYAADHYPTWRDELGEAGAHLHPGGFGENVSALGLTEDLLCVGDVLQMGTATVQVSQGRQPCWKLNAHTGLPRMATLFQRTARTGWYYRVLEGGHVALGDRIALVERLHPGWTIDRVTRARLGPGLAPEEAAALADLAALAPGWRAAFRRKIDPGAVEDTSARLNRP
jgi:MOSC domain-containing protein YiiM